MVIDSSAVMRNLEFTVLLYFLALVKIVLVELALSPLLNLSSKKMRNTELLQRGFLLFKVVLCLQCFDAVGWMAGRAFGL